MRQPTATNNDIRNNNNLPTRVRALGRECLLEERRLGPARRDEHHFARRVQHGERQRDAFRRGLRRVRDGRHLLSRLLQQRVPREEGRRVPVRPHTQQNGVEPHRAGGLKKEVGRGGK